MSLFVAGAVFGDLGVSLFVASAVFRDLGVALFVAGAVFGDLGVSLFVAGAVFGEIWVDSRSAKCCNFQYKMRCRGGKSKLCERLLISSFIKLVTLALGGHRIQPNFL